MRCFVASFGAVTASTILAASIVGPCHAAGDPVTVRPVLAQPLPNVPGKSVTMVRVTIPPGGGSPPHHHAGSVAVYVLSGAIRSQVNDQPARTYHAGETFFEPEGALHALSQNPSASEPAELLAVFVADTGAVLTKEAK